ncbi:hypothetical protein DAI22_02g085900 [Oryza sativa Japonica Group]|nr:hypothetical protein DAI22_02g085900 [Oryza sativa Japonica Group]
MAARLSVGVGLQAILVTSLLLQMTLFLPCALATDGRKPSQLLIMGREMHQGLDPTKSTRCRRILVPRLVKHNWDPGHNPPCC